MNREEKSRRPIGYWETFNIWWREKLREDGRRPSQQELSRWYDANSSQCWTQNDVPSLKELRTHAKCLRSTEQVRNYFRAYRQARKANSTSIRTFESDSESDYLPADSAAAIQLSASAPGCSSQLDPGSASKPQRSHSHIQHHGSVAVGNCNAAMPYVLASYTMGSVLGDDSQIQAQCQGQSTGTPSRPPVPPDPARSGPHKRTPYAKYTARALSLGLPPRQPLPAAVKLSMPSGATGSIAEAPVPNYGIGGSAHLQYFRGLTPTPVSAPGGGTASTEPLLRLPVLQRSSSASGSLHCQLGHASGMTPTKHASPTPAEAVAPSAKRLAVLRGTGGSLDLRSGDPSTSASPVPRNTGQGGSAHVLALDLTLPAASLPPSKLDASMRRWTETQPSTTAALTAGPRRWSDTDPICRQAHPAVSMPSGQAAGLWALPAALERALAQDICKPPGSQSGVREEKAPVMKQRLGLQQRQTATDGDRELMEQAAGASLSPTAAFFSAWQSDDVEDLLLDLPSPGPAAATGPVAIVQHQGMQAGMPAANNWTQRGQPTESVTVHARDMAPSAPPGPLPSARTAPEAGVVSTRAASVAGAGPSVSDSLPGSAFTTRTCPGMAAPTAAGDGSTLHAASQLTSLTGMQGKGQDAQRDKQAGGPPPAPYGAYSPYPPYPGHGHMPPPYPSSTADPNGAAPSMHGAIYPPPPPGYPYPAYPHPYAYPPPPPYQQGIAPPPYYYDHQGMASSSYYDPYAGWSSYPTHVPYPPYGTYPYYSGYPPPHPGAYGMDPGAAGAPQIRGPPEASSADVRAATAAGGRRSLPVEGGAEPLMPGRYVWQATAKPRTSGGGASTHGGAGGASSRGDAINCLGVGIGETPGPSIVAASAIQLDGKSPMCGRLSHSHNAANASRGGVCAGQLIVGDNQEECAGADGYRNPAATQLFSSYSSEPMPDATKPQFMRLGRDVLGGWERQPLPQQPAHIAEEGCGEASPPAAQVLQPFGSSTSPASTRPALVAGDGSPVPANAATAAVVAATTAAEPCPAAAPNSDTAAPAGVLDRGMPSCGSHHVDFGYVPAIKTSPNDAAACSHAQAACVASTIPATTCEDGYMDTDVELLDLSMITGSLFSPPTSATIQTAGARSGFAIPAHTPRNRANFTAATPARGAHTPPFSMAATSFRSHAFAAPPPAPASHRAQQVLASVCKAPAATPGTGGGVPGASPADGVLASWLTTPGAGSLPQYDVRLGATAFDIGSQPAPTKSPFGGATRMDSARANSMAADAGDENDVGRSGGGEHARMDMDAFLNADGLGELLDSPQSAVEAARSADVLAHVSVRQSGKGGLEARLADGGARVAHAEPLQPSR